MYHSVNFTLPGKWTKNSHDDFHLVPDGRPIITMPEPVTNYIEIPGASGQLDMSESLTNYPLYGHREGTLSFIVLNDYEENDSWIKRYQQLGQYLHGRRLEMSLEDDPDYFYEGRFSVSNWESPSDGGNSTVDIDYTLDTYKYWDNEIVINKSVSGSSTTVYFSKNDMNLGTMPTVPVFQISKVSNNITIQASNPELYSGSLQHTVSSSATYQFQDIVLMDFDGTNRCSITLNGRGDVTIRLRNGEL